MRAFLLVIDSFGIGALPDAADYGDEGSNTAVHIARAVGGAEWPNLTSMGLGNASALLGEQLPGVPVQTRPTAGFGVMREVSPGKDTTTGHWELAGFQLEKPFPVFRPSFPSFPKQLLDRLTAVSGYEFLGNKAASGTEIIEELDEIIGEGEAVVDPIPFVVDDDEELEELAGCGVRGVWRHAFGLVTGQRGRSGGFVHRCAPRLARF